jgi:peptide/nickel transport system permease protein
MACRCPPSSSRDILKFIFSVKLGWFDLYGSSSYYEQLNTWAARDMAPHGLPCVTLACSPWRLMALYPHQHAGGALLDYFRTARPGLERTRGHQQARVPEHAIPLISYMSYMLRTCSPARWITETLSNTGIGYIAYQALVARHPLYDSNLVF